MRSIWKWIGLAGVAGVVAGGAVVARDQRKRRAYTADEVRARLQQRLAEDSFQSRSASAAISTANVSTANASTANGSTANGSTANKR